MAWNPAGERDCAALPCAVVESGDFELVGATVRDVADVSDASLERVRPMLTIRRLVPGHSLLRAGSRAVMAAIVLEGVLREFFVSTDGRDHTRGFAYERTFVGSLSDLVNGTAAEMTIEALTDVRVAQIPWAHFNELARIDAEWSSFARALTERAYLKKSAREAELLSLSAADRYAYFCDRYPGLRDRVPLRHVASFLGITPEHLSRLRRRGAQRATSTRRSG
jgi:CRP-like cAMP-binding protein